MHGTGEAAAAASGQIPISVWIGFRAGRSGPAIPGQHPQFDSQKNPAMSSVGAAPCAAPISSAAPRRAASTARDRASKTPKASTLGADRADAGLRAQKHVVLPGEDAAAFHALEAALIEELAPEGALQSVLAQRVVVRPGASSAPSGSRRSCSPTTTLPAAASGSP